IEHQCDAVPGAGELLDHRPYTLLQGTDGLKTATRLIQGFFRRELQIARSMHADCPGGADPPASTAPTYHAPHVSLPAGTMLGPYEVLSLLGAGGMGEVYRARDTRLDRVVAVKVLRSGLTGSGDLRARFEREARAI